jgi:hypothetical protein
VAFLAGGLVAVNRYEQVTVHDPAARRKVFVVKDRWPVRAMAAAPDGGTLWLALSVAGDPRDRLRRYDVPSRAFAGLPVSAAGEVWQLGLAGGVLVSGASKVVRAWRVDGGKSPKRAAMVGKLPGGWVTAVAASADGRFVAAAARKVAVVWDVATGAEVCRVSHKQFVKGVAFHPRRPVLATASLDGTAAFWDAATGAKLQQFAWPVGPLYAVAFAPDGLRCAALGQHQVVVWDVE